MRWFLGWLVCALAASGERSALGPVLHGRVLNEAQGPVAGARLELLPLESNVSRAQRLVEENAPPPLASATTGESGSFDLSAPGAGVYRLRASAPGLVPREVALAPLLEDETLPDVSLSRDAGCAVTVLDAGRRPQRGAWVAGIAQRDTGVDQSFDERSWELGESLGKTDDSGRVRLQCGSGKRLAVRAFARASCEGKGTVKAGSGATVHLQAGVGLRVLVRGANGKPRAGVLVLDAKGWPLATSAANGGATVMVPRLVGSDLLFAAADGAARTMHVLGVARAEPLVVDLEAPRSGSGRVLDERTRQPIAGALVWTRSMVRAVRTDTAGSYTLTLELGDFQEIRAAATAYATSYQLAWGGLLLGRAPTIVLPPTFALRGRVVDEKGQPVVNVKVRGEPQRGFETWRADLTENQPRAAVSRDGRFALKGLLFDVGYAVAALARNFAVEARDLPPVRDSSRLPGDWTIVVRRGASVFGHVVDGQGKLLAGVTVVWTAAAFSNPRRGVPSVAIPERERRATSDARGRFEMQHLPPQRYSLKLSAQGFASLETPALSVEAGSGSQDLGTFRLEPGVTLVGRVLNTQRSPVANAQVWLGRWRRSPDSDTEVPDAETGADGGFTLVDRRSGDRLDLVVTHSGFSPEVAPQVKVDPERLVELTLRPSVRATGRVHDAYGQAVTDARVVFRPGSAEFRYSTTACDADGRFVIEDLPLGRLDLQAEAPGWQTAKLSSLLAESGKNLENLDLLLKRAATLHGRVLAADDQPVVGASVEIESSPSGSATTDGDGQYSITSAPLGAQRIVATSGSGRRSVEQIQIEAGDNERDLRLRVGTSVAGVVLDPDGRPVGDAEVRLYGVWPAATTDAGGNFHFADLSDGQYRLSASAEGYATAPEMPIAVKGAPVEGLEVRLQPGATLHGALRGLAFGLLGGLTIQAHRLGLTGDWASGQAEATGHYQIDGLSPGDWAVSAEVEGRHGEGKAHVEGGSDNVLDLDFTSGLVLSGVVRRGGKPLADAGVWVEGMDRSASGEARTDLEGQFRIAGLTRGHYALRVVSSSTGAEKRDTFDLDGDREIQIELTAAAVSGVVVGATDGSPLEGASVELRPIAGRDNAPRTSWAEPLGATTDSHGAFRFAEVGSGTYGLEARKEGYAASRQSAQVGADDLTDVVFRLETSAGLALDVAGPGAAPFNVRIAVLDTNGNWVYCDSALSLDSGRVRFSSVPPGSWQALVASTGSAVARLSVTVPGPPVPVTLLPYAQLDVMAPDLADSDALATLTLIDASGVPFLVPLFGSLRSTWSLEHGHAVVRSLPPGTWTLRASASDGRVFAATATTAAGSTGTVTLQDTH
ncbi:MAG TPA: carboxypeptidase regulatory-like domain-containing protein [Thermoanaerobaculia bacterium]|nr:carboxypeptidase regulatory-like domain-containing protein [Thermoanaerobaculia bacterium]